MVRDQTSRDLGSWPLQRARDAAYRVFGYPPSRPSSAYSERPGEGSRRASTARFGTIQNFSASHYTGLGIHTLAINGTGTHALLGGKELFKTIKVEDGTCVEDFNLQTAIIGSRQKSIDIADVAWARCGFSDYAAAATSSGDIILYNLVQNGPQATHLNEHYRQVHRVTFNPEKCNLLLSGSQDGTARLWDLRTRDNRNVLRSKRKFSGQSDGIRDVKWSPDGMRFALGTDDGWFQCWDMRQWKSPKLKIAAHALSCNSVDWHPDGRHVTSGSSDKRVRVWDTSVSGRQQSKWEVITPYPIMHTRWRPVCESQGPEGRLWQCTQLVTSYDRSHPIVHTWDFRRPALPFRAMRPHASAPTDLLWHSQNLLWTVGREGFFEQTDVQSAPKLLARRTLHGGATSVDGDLTFVSQTRGQDQSHSSHHSYMSIHASNTGSGNSTETNYLSRSWTDDTLDESFLSMRLSGNGPLKSPTLTDTSVTPFDKSMADKGPCVPRQVGIVGKIPYQIQPHVFCQLACDCQLYIAPEPDPDEDLFSRTIHTFSFNQGLAHQCGQHRLAQTWKIVGYCALMHVKDRTQFEQKKGRENLVKRRDLGALALRLLQTESNSILASPRSHLVSRSNVPTPLVLPTHVNDKLPQIELNGDSLSGGAAARCNQLEVESKELLPAHASVESLSFLDPTLPSTYRSETSTEPDVEEALKNAAKDEPKEDSQSSSAVTEALNPLGLSLGELKPTGMPSIASSSMVDLETNKPFTLVGMLKELLKYYAGEGDAQAACQLLLVFMPLLPCTHPLERKTKTVSLYANTFSAMGFTDDAIVAIFKQRLEHLIYAGLQPLEVESVLSTYHEQLVAHRLFAEASSLRKLAYPTYPAVYEDYIGSNEFHPMCGSCGCPLMVGPDGLNCGRCDAQQLVCAFCDSKDSPFGLSKLTTLCINCNHGGHAECLHEWFENSREEMCPTGCGCECSASKFSK
ncbi:WD40 repeat-like protein [Piedraia hortae CBS 480.64]|uniref:Restriction of telomere capping protein 1 n=1 Tax=Piedraia hortae CBS 480.64 TaxID=1314780 RepID=A0A6A7BWY0_9PEZI|nr:WD40 repeat-like protein [Piedraia hortae CBS 480.64]